MPPNRLGAVAFLMKRPDGEGNLNYNDIRDLLEIMHKKKIDKGVCIIRHCQCLFSTAVF